jgi:hypothetical protein
VFCIQYSAFCILYSVLYVVSFMFCCPNSHRPDGGGRRKREPLSLPHSHPYSPFHRTILALWTYDLYSPVLNAFWCGQIHYKSCGRGYRVLEIETFLGPVKWHQAIRGVPFGPKKFEISRAQLPPTCLSYGFARIKSITYRAVSIRDP